MMEHRHAPDELQAGPSFQSPPFEQGPALRDPRLEDYLDHVMAPLVKAVPYARRQEMRAEMAEHLDALVAACAELSGEHDPVAEALERFGDPGAVSRSWAGAGIAGTVATSSGGFVGFGASLRLAGKLYGSATLIFWAAMAAMLVGGQPQGVVADVIAPTLIALLPVAMSLVLAIRARTRPGVAAFAVLTFLAAVSFTAAQTLPPVVAFVSAGGISAERAQQEFLAVPMIQGLFWIAVGSVTAGVTRWSLDLASRFSFRGSGFRGFRVQ